jgi:hypothetical protein
MAIGGIMILGLNGIEGAYMISLDKWGTSGSGKTLYMRQYAKLKKGIEVFSNYSIGTNINVNINVDEILKEVKQPLRMDQRIEKLMGGNSNKFYQIRR